MIAYKVFNHDWKCRDFQFKVGETFSFKGKIEPCKSGFHACLKLNDCFSYYSFDSKNKVAEVEILGEYKTHDEDSKIVTNKILIKKELSWIEVLGLCNSGEKNTGRLNSGYLNSGNRNSGDQNSGDLNSGNRNSGYLNSGYQNSGDQNSGNRNSGDQNSGDLNSGNRNSGYLNSGYQNSGNRNSGDQNSGDYNSGNYNSGCFNSKNPDKVMCFNRMIPFNDFIKIKKSEGYGILTSFSFVKYRVKKQTNKNGDWRFLSYKSSFKYFFNKLSLVEKLEIRKIPFFDSNVFYEITGVKL